MKDNFKKPNIDFKAFKDFKVRISQIPPLDVAFQTMALSDYELLVATIYRLNELITYTNSYTELINEILIWVVNDGLEEAVLNKLLEWKEDGTLETLINDALFKSKLDKEEFNEFVSDIYEVFVDGIDVRINELENDLNDLNEELTLKADKTELTDGLDLKADKTELTDGLDLKADKTELTDGLDLKVDKTELEELITGLPEFEGDLDVRIDDLETDFNNKVATLETSKLDITEFKKAIKNTHFDLHLRVERDANRVGQTSGTTKYFTPQGSCVIGNNIVIAFINGGMSSIPADNQVSLVEYNMATGTKIRENNEKLHHANGLDYHPTRDKIYVAYTNDLGAPDNRIGVINRNTLALEKTITPSGLPSGRRVKSFMYDKVTGKSYVSDDRGAFEVNINSNNDMTVIRTINWGDDYLNQNPPTPRQNSAVHDGKFYHLGMSNAHIAVFENDGALIDIIDLPRLIGNGLGSYLIGSEVQSVSLNDEGDLFLTTVYDHIGRHGTTFASYVFKTNLTHGIVFKPIPYTNRRTHKYVYVDASTNHKRPDGQANAPFNNLYEAYQFVADQPMNYGVTIRLKAGNYDGFDLSADGRAIYIEGQEAGVNITSMRIYHARIHFKNINFIPDTIANYTYTLMISSSEVYFVDCNIDGGNKTNGIYAESGSILSGNDSNTINNATNGVYLSSSMLLGRYDYGNTTNDVEKRAYSVYTYGDIT